MLFYGPIYFVALPFRKGLQYCNYDLKRLERMNISTSRTILVTFGPETSEFTLLTIAPFVAIRQKSAYYANYLRMVWTYLDLLYTFGRHISRDDFPSIRLAVAQGTLLCQPVQYGRCSQTSHGTNLFFALAFENGLADRKSAFKIFNGNNQATSCLNLVNFHPIISGVYAVKTHNFYRDTPPI